MIVIELIYSNLTDFTDFTDFMKPCKRKEKYTFANVCIICIYAKCMCYHGHVKRVFVS